MRTDLIAALTNKVSNFMCEADGNRYSGTIASTTAAAAAAAATVELNYAFGKLWSKALPYSLVCRRKSSNQTQLLLLPLTQSSLRLRTHSLNRELPCTPQSVGDKRADLMVPPT